ncbi:MAG: hypothetical protein PWR22_846 [Moorella sp. (in: firmicutes)]|nr:hypothetical protein [Moorella sp. (in: firmicutes)]
MEKQTPTFPPHIEKILKERGYFNYSKEDRIKSCKQYLDTLSNLPKPSYEGARRALRALRGGCDE